MNWLILIIAGLFETTFAFCLGKAQETTGKENLYWWSGFAVCLFFFYVSHVQSYFWRKWFANRNSLRSLDRNWSGRKRFDGNLFL